MHRQALVKSLWGAALALGPAVCGGLLWSGEDENPPTLSLRHAPPVHGLHDVTLIDDRLWTAAVSRRPQLISTAPAAVVVLTDEDLRLSPAANWADRLRYVAGVDVYQSRHAQYDVGLRGYNALTNQHLIIRVDGREFGRSVTGEQYGHWSGFMFLSDIERVEVVKGPSSVTYGANAFGGVISLTGRRVGDEPEVHFHSHIGSYGKREVDATVLLPLASAWQGLDGFTMKVSAGYTEAEPRPGTTLEVQESHPRLGDTGDKDIQAHRQRVILGRRWLDDAVALEVEYAGKQMHDQALTSPYTAVTSQGEFEEHGFGVLLRSEWGQIRHWRQRTNATWSSEYIRYLGDLPPAGRGDFYYNQAGFRDRRHSTEVDTAWTMGDHTISIGGAYQRWGSTSNIWSREAHFMERDTWATVTNRSWGVFAEDQWIIDDQWSLTAGLRFDHDSRVGENWSPRIGLNYIIDEQQFLRVSYSQGYRIPNMIENHIQVYFYESDPDLDAERIQAVEAGYERQFVDDRGSLVVNAHYSRAEDLITFEPLPEAEMQANWLQWVMSLQGLDPDEYPRTPGPFFAYTNSDNPVTVWGAEISGSWLVEQIAGGDINLWGNATWQRFRHKDRTRYQSDGFIDPLSGETIFAFDGELPRDINAPPEWKATLGASWDNQHWHLGVAGRYVGSRIIFSQGNTFWRQQPDPDMPDLAVQRIDAYMALDFHAAWRRHIGASLLWLRAGVMDVFDSAHYESYERSQAELEADDAKSWTSEVGRSWYLALDWQW
ncbi:MAG: TonB-dependent receptor [Planctomycetota bacterium]|nr:MAG: TonB-dependent receptor [Planctomycetota bacterium]